jgi:DNA repair ATPase RecN
VPGLRFLKLDLHTHTPASKCYRDSQHTPEQIVQSALSQGLAAIAITDHNTAGWVEMVQKAAAGTDLVIFPGVEVSMNEGYHLVALFDPGTDQKHIENFLGAIDITAAEYGKQEALCKKGIYDVLDKIHDRNGLAVLAHIDCPRGAFHDQAKAKENGGVSVPNQCSTLFNNPAYDAVECAEGRLPVGFDATHHITRLPALYQASDNPDPSEVRKHSMLGIGTRYSLFKLDEVNLEGLRQCFADPEARIRLIDQGQELPYPKIVALRVGDTGFLAGQSFEFEGGLNSIIGGKGAGKSLAVEFLRFGLGQHSPDRSLIDDLVRKLEIRLGANGTVRVVYQLVDGTRYQIDRTFVRRRKDDIGFDSTHTCVNVETGAPFNGDVSQMFPILAYSQTEIVRISENKRAQLELIDTFVDKRSPESRIEDLRAKLRVSDKQVSDGLAARDRLVSCETQINTLTEQIKVINRALSDPLFEAMQAAEEKTRALDALDTFVQGLVTKTQTWQSAVTALALPSLPTGRENDPILKAQWSGADAALQRVRRTLLSLITELGGDKRALTDRIATWLPEFEVTSSEYRGLLDRLGSDRKSKELERKELQDRLDSLQTEAKGYRDLTAGLAGLRQARARLLDELQAAYLQCYTIRKDKFEELTRLSDAALRLTIEHSIDRSAYELCLSDLLKGRLNSLSVADRKSISANVDPRRLVELVLERDAASLAGEAGITELWAERAIEKLWSTEDFTEVLALQHNCHPSDVPTIQFRKPGGQYDELSNLSVGQRCTALLIIALCDGTMPVVIDQPEDALDIRSVWEDIAQKLRRGKSSRQFVLTTHNSTVAVAGDSEQFIVLAAASDRGWVTAAGAIDREDVRGAVVDHLEGGPEPYKLKSRKYNIG